MHMPMHQTQTKMMKTSRQLMAGTIRQARRAKISAVMIVMTLTPTR